MKMLNEAILNGHKKFESHLSSFKQNIKLLILSNVNNACAIYVFVYI